MNHVEPVQERETALNIKSILVAADLSSHSDRTVAYALSIARQCGASLKLIHVYAPPASIAFGTEDIYRLLENESEKRRTASDQSGGIKCESLFITGDPAEQVARAASVVRADLIVVGRHHRTLLGRFFKLDQAPKIVHRATCRFCCGTTMMIESDGGSDMNIRHELTERSTPNANRAPRSA